MKKFSLALIVAMFIGSAVLYPSLPNQLPMHWNFRGEIDSYGPKSFAAWFIPLLASLMWALFQFLPQFDPHKEKYQLFKKEWQMIQTGIIGFFTYLHFAIFYVSLNPTVPFTPLMFIGLGSLFVLLGNYLSKIRQNYFIGFKLPWTLASEENWNKTHRFASWCFVIAGVGTLIQAVFPWHAPVLIFGGLILASVLPTVYSFLLFKKAPDKMRYVYLAVIVITFVLLFIRIIAGEDDWICRNGQWVKHGQPTAAQPSEPCLKTQQ